MDSITNSLDLDVARLPPKLAPQRKTSLAPLVLGAFAVAAAGAVLFWFNPAQYRFYPFCFFHELTGLHCPGCGGTRALHQLLHGNLAGALRFNALVVASLPFFVWLGIRIAAQRIRPRQTGAPFSSWWLWIVLVSAVVFAMLRNLPAFAWLSP